MLEPRARTVDPDMLMGMLFRNSDLEIRFALNMNVLIDGRTPQVCSLKEVLRAFLDHRREVLQRRSAHRLEKIDHRLEVLRRLHHRLSEPRPGDRDHPLRGRAQARADGRRLGFGRVPDRRAGRGDPEHAAAQPAAAGGDGAARRARRADGRAGRAGGAAGRRRRAMEAHREPSLRRSQGSSARARPLAPGAATSPRRAKSRMCRSRR